jgi:hypothetical protein
MGRSLRGFSAPLFALFFGFLCSVSWAENENEAPIKVFFQLLQEYSKVPQLLPEINEDEKKEFQKITLERLKRLPEKSMESRYKQFNVDYKTYVNLQNQLARELKTREAVLDRTPVTAKDRTYIETTVEAQKGRLATIGRYLFYSSVNANRSVLSALKTFSPKDEAAASASSGEGSPGDANALTAGPVTPPKMPGVYGGSREDRMKQAESEKINLTPVDAEFYDTELGKKMEKDLGGRADFWSYDYEKDELYIKVKNDTGKLSVKDEGSGVRFVQTKSGQGYVEPVGSAMKVDLYKAQGRFLTGDLNQETLFGPMPQKGDLLMDEDDIKKGIYRVPPKTLPAHKGSR